MSDLIFLRHTLTIKALPRLLVLLAGTVLFTGCADWMTRPPETIPPTPKPLRVPKTTAATPLGPDVSGPTVAAWTSGTGRGSTQPATRFGTPPKVPLGPTVAGQNYESGVTLSGEALQVNIENLPLPAFINEVYGNLLELSFDIASDLKSKTDLVTLRVTTPQPPDELYRLAGIVLQDYGVSVTDRGGVLHFNRGRATPLGEPPLLVSGRTLPEVPSTHRPIFQLVPLRNVGSNNLKGWLSQIYKGQPLEVNHDFERNAILLLGPSRLVGQALEAIELLDQPALRGRFSLRIEPAFKSPTDIGDALIKVLQAEGYAASDNPDKGGILVLPMDDIGMVLVFAGDRALLSHARQWASQLDQPTQSATGPQGRLFYYPVKSTRAKTLAETLTKLLGDLSVDISRSMSAAGAPAGARATESVSIARTDTRGQPKLVVDESRNALLFYGQPEVWARVLPIIRQMDTPAKQILIEITVAEVTLNEDEQFGIEWLAKGALTNNYDYSFGTLGGFGIFPDLGGGFNFVLANAGNTRVVLNALAVDQRVNILSTPRVMVRSGSTASIEVGTEVPIITSQATTPDAPVDGGTSSILQNIQYRKTGVLLSVSPVVHAGQWVDLDVRQEISRAQPTTTSGVDSPSILNRSIETSLTLRDGGSVLLGGLISSDATSSTQGVPLLMDIPIIGKAFSTEVTSATRTEMVMLIIPYVIDDANEAESITKAFRDRLTNPTATRLPFSKRLTEAPP